MSFQAPPPDEPQLDASTSASTPRAAPRSWLPAQAHPPSSSTSYQAGGIPTFGTSLAGGDGASPADDIESYTNPWETTYGMRVDMLAASAYVLGPLSGVWMLPFKFHCREPNLSLAFILLITETKSDYVRFHGDFSAQS